MEKYKCKFCNNFITCDYMCDDCWECECEKCEACDYLNELAYENFMEDFYGSSDPFTLSELGIIKEKKK